MIFWGELKYKKTINAHVLWFLLLIPCFIIFPLNIHITCAYTIEEDKVLSANEQRGQPDHNESYQAANDHHLPLGEHLTARHADWSYHRTKPVHVMA